MIMSIKKGVDRHQIEMYCLEEQVSTESEARVIEAFVEFLDLTKYKFGVIALFFRPSKLLKFENQYTLTF